MNRGLLIVLSGPSGVGKGTILKKVLNRFDGLVLSVSATTREMRQGEKDGVDYHFISFDKFRSMINEGELLEYAIVYDNYYGTIKDTTLELIESGHDVILELDTVGAMNIKKMYQEAVTIFLMPPDKDTLVRRLKGRATESEEVFIKRIAAATEELNRADEYDYMILNDDADRCADDVIEVIETVKNNRR